VTYQFRFKQKYGTHYAKRRRFAWPGVVESDSRLDQIYPNKFVLVGEDEVVEPKPPRPPRPPAPPTPTPPPAPPVPPPVEPVVPVEPIVPVEPVVPVEPEVVPEPEVIVVDHPSPLGLLEPVPVDESEDGIEEEGEMRMGHFIKNSQPIQAAPVDKGVTGGRLKVEETVGESTLTVLDAELAFDPTIGEYVGDALAYWAQVGATVTRTLSWHYGAEEKSFVSTYVQEDNYTPPNPGPSDIPEATQVDEVEADERPTG
jgi:hypothetical protein